MKKNERLIEESSEIEDKKSKKEIKNFSFSKNSPIKICKNFSPEHKLNEKGFEEKREGNLIKNRKNNITINNRRNIHLQVNSFHSQLTKSNEIKFNNNYFTNDTINEFKLNDIVKNCFDSPKKLNYKEDDYKCSNQNNGNIICYRNQRFNRHTNFDTPNLIDKTKQLIKETILKDEKIKDKEEKENNDKILNHIRDYRQYSLSQDMLDEQTTFYFDQYFEMILLHFVFFILGPFLPFFMRFKYGKNLSHNMNFWGDKLIKALILQYFFWMTTLLTIILSIIIWNNTYKDSESQFNNQYIFLSIGYMSQISIIIRYLTVCVKYGFFPRGYYELFKKEDLMEHSLKSNFLYNGWINPRFKIIDELINESLLENKIDLSIFNLQCIGKIDTKLIHDLKMIELEISEDQEKLKNEYLMYLLKKVQLNKYKDILKNTKLEEKMFKIRKITSDEISMEKREVSLINKENKLNLTNIDKSDKIANDNPGQASCSVENCNPIVFYCNENEKQEHDMNISNVKDFKVDAMLSSEMTLTEKKLTNSGPDSFIQIEKTNTDLSNKKDIDEIDYESDKTHPHLTNNKSLSTRLRDVVLNKVFPIIYQNRKKKAEKINTLDGKVKKLSDFVFEINGLYLCRLIMKKAHDINYASYFCYQVLFFITLLIIPNIFLGRMYEMYTEKGKNKTELIDCNKFNATSPTINSVGIENISNYRFLQDFNLTNEKINENNFTSFTDENFVSNSQTFNNTNIMITENNSTNIKTNNGSHIDTIDKIINQEICKTNWNSVSFLIWIFSIITAIFPTWLITKNLIYGMIDFERRRKLLEIISEIVNINTTGKRDFHLINITHYETLINWYTLRNIFMNYGKRFTDRLIIQVTILCVFVLISLIIMIFIFLGYIQHFIFMIIGLCFVAQILINFIMIFRMIKIGADYNYYENTHIDLLFTNKIIMDSIYLKIKKERLREEYSHKLSVSKRDYRRDSIDCEKANDDNDLNYNTIFSNIIRDDDDISNDLGDLREYHSKIIYVHNNIAEKIKMDHLIRPLRIFWIKADYFLFTKILTIASGGLFMFFSYIIADTLQQKEILTFST